MAEKVYVTSEVPQAGPNSRVRMGEHVLAVITETQTPQISTNNQEVPRATTN